MGLKPNQNPTGYILDEKWSAQLVRYGLAEIEVYLAKQAAFDAWCAEHDRSTRA